MCAAWSSSGAGRVSRDLRSLLVLLAAASAGCEAGPGDDVEPAFARADSIVATWVGDERIPGAVLLVSRDGAVAHERSWGFARLHDFGSGQYPGDGGISRIRSPAPMAVSTIFDLASVTKVMATTMAVMMLADRGDIDVEAPLSRWLHDFTGDGRDQITVRHLLTHRSGLPQWLPLYYDARDPDTAYARIRTVPLTWPVGEERHYSDLGFMLLGRLVEEVSGRPLDIFLTEELYAPLGLAETTFRPAPPTAAAPSALAATSHGNPFERRMVHDPDFGYRIEGDPERWSDWRRYTLVGEVNDGNAHHAFDGVAGHAGLFSTAADLDVLLRLLLGQGEMNGRRFLSAEIVRTFLTSTGDGQALGWQLPAYAPEGSFGHTGFTGTFVLGVPGEGLALVLLTNRQNVGVDEFTQYTDVGPLQRAITEALTR